MEEENFAKTIDGGLKIFSDMLAEHKAKGESVFSGADAFKLYDTFGFPVDLTIEMAQDEGLTVDEAGFAALMDEQRARARTAREALGDLGWAGIEYGKEMPETVFTGYDKYEDTGKILALVAEEELRERIGSGVEGIVVLDQTPFYAEMGGQIADTGTLTCGEAVFQVTGVQKNKGGKYMHYGVLKSGELSVGDTVTAAIDKERRQAIARALSATHLLQKALQTVLGDHVHQAGSLVEPDRLRFDFTHFSALTVEEILKIEELVNEAILRGYDVDTKEMPIDEARQLGAMALFGEKYGDVVRVVDMGGYSVELCGGTHLDNTAKAGSFHIVSEFSVASGVRRIEAITGKETLDQIKKNNAELVKLAEVLKVNNMSELVEKARQHMGEIRELHRMVEAYKAKEAAGDAERFLMGARKVGGFNVVTATLADASVDQLRQMGDRIRQRDDNNIAVLSAVAGEKITFLAVCGKNAVAAGIRAGDLVKNVSKICGGSGGGKPDSAMGGGKDPLKVDDALAAVDDFVAEKLGQ